MSVRTYAIQVADHFVRHCDGQAGIALNLALSDDLDDWEIMCDEAGVPLNVAISPLIPVVRTILRDRINHVSPFEGFPSA